MRIVSISGQNIASLSERFDIDFTAAPLNGAGLFAITGETGAGKSSILDAMCLALYGDAPRLASGASGDEVPDPSGDTIKAKDARAVLRRGAAQGWAEVRFTGLDGQDYVARWQARRARDKADGKLQLVARSVARVSDQQILASQANSVTEQVTALTGLSYEEFRRTVLLAQGDFDAFLRADTNERAGLLEKVTGTGQYRSASIRVFERTEAARQAHRALVLRRGEHQLLSEQERAELGEEAAALASENTKALVEREELEAQLGCHARFSESVDLLASAEAAETEALSAVRAMQPVRVRLEKIDKAEPLRPLWTTAHDTSDRVTQLQPSLSELLQQRDKAAGIVKALSVGMAGAEDALFKIEAEFKALGPLWDQAAQLDAQIETATGELALAQLDLTTAVGIAQAEAETLGDLRKAESEAELAVTKSEDELNNLVAAQDLADRSEQVLRDIQTYQDACKSAEEAESLVAELAKNLENSQERSDALVEAMDIASREEGGLQREIESLSDQVANLKSKHPVSMVKQLADLSVAFRAMKRVADDRTVAQNDLTEAQSTLALALRDESEAKAAMAVAAETLTLQEGRISALISPAEQADLALSDAARNLRLRLEPETPCPVCGSIEHPVHAEAALADLALRLRSDLGSARQAAQDARNAQSAGGLLLARADAKAEQARNAIDSATKRLEAADGELSSARNEAMNLPGCPELPQAPWQDIFAFQALLKQISEAQIAETKAQSDIEEIRRKLDDVSKKRESLRELIKGKASDQEKLAKEKVQVDRDLVVGRQIAHNHNALKDSLGAALAPLLASLCEPPEALRDPALSQRLGALVSRVTSARDARARARDTLLELVPKMAGQTSKSEACAITVGQTRERANTRQAALDDLRVRRASLLGGEPTSAHRTRFNESRKAAHSLREETQKTFADAKNQAIAAATRYTSAETEFTSAKEAAIAARAKLLQALEGLKVSEEALAEVFGSDLTEVHTLRDSLRSVDDALIAARAAAAARRLDLEGHQKALPRTSQEDLSAKIMKLNEEANARQQRLGAVENQLGKDDEIKQKLAGLEVEIGMARAEFDVWSAVNAAVGSRSGDRFARYAQSITLDVLTDSANRHLAELNPRYRLRRAAELALQVEDVEMGGEARATRSLSGGERFLVSLALALALSRMGGKGGLAATLFIDEGFGSLDATSLDLAIDALEGLQSQGRQVGVISHVDAMKDRIPVQIMVSKLGGGRSSVRITGNCVQM